MLEQKLEPIPQEDFDIEKEIVSADVMGRVLGIFPISLGSPRVLYIGRVGEGRPGWCEEYPDLKVDCWDLAQLEGCLIPGPRLSREGPGYHFIIAASVRYLSSRVPLLRVLQFLRAQLEPGGKVALAVYGYAGYYGLEMVARLLRGLVPGIEKQDISKIQRVVKALVSQLPVNHPVFHRPVWVDRLEKGDMETIRQLINMEKENIFTVRQLMQVVKESGGGFEGWIFPGYYNPVRYIEDPALVGVLQGLKGVDAWQVAENINAFPPEHYFLFS